jgi:hypothetical protein
MADITPVKISQLSLTEFVNPGDNFVLSRNGVTVRVSFEKIGQALTTLTGGVGSFSLTSGVLTARGEYFGATAPTLSTSAAGNYVLTVPAGTRVISFTVFGNNAVLNGSNEFVLRIDNTANAIQRSYTVSQYVANTGAAADKFSLGTNETETFPTTNVTQLLFPGMNGYGTTGFRLVLA